MKEKEELNYASKNQFIKLDFWEFNCYRRNDQKKE
jgi:hypothetical protein